MADQKKKKASGVNIPEAQRKTMRVVLRLPPEVADRIADLADRWRITKSGVVGRLLAAYDGEEEGG